MKKLLIFLLLFAAIKVAGQTTGYLRFDTVKIMKQNGTCELYIINKTRDSLGLLTNIGGGLTRFINPTVLNDSMFVVGLDTLKIVGNSPRNENVASGYRILIPSTQQLKTFFAGYGILNDSTTNANGITQKVDSSNLSTRAWRQKGVDSVVALLAGLSNFYTTNGTISSDRTVTQSGRFIKFQDGYPYIQFNAAKTTKQPDSTGSSYILEEVKSPFAGTATQGILSWYDGFGFADQAPQRPNYPRLRGFNIGMGGGLATVNVPAIAESIEPHYRPDPVGGTPWLMEWHDFYVTPQGKQIRMKSYTINTGTNFIDYYMTLGNYVLKDTSLRAWFATSRDIALKTAQLFLLSTETGHGLAITADSTNKTVNFQPANSLTTTSFMADQWKNINFPGHFFDLTGFTTPGHLGPFNIFRTSSQAILNLKSGVNTRGYILTDDGTGFMDYQCQATYEMRWIEGSNERMRLLAGGKLMIGTTGATAGQHPRGLYVAKSVGFLKDSIPTISNSTSNFLLTQDTTSGANNGRVQKTQFAQSTYTPTLTNGANVDASAVPGTTLYYERIGNRVHVWGMLEVDPTSTATSTVVSISLPAASALTQYYQLAGRGSGNVLAGAYFGGFIQGDAANDRAQLDFTSGTNINAVWSIDFWYEIL